MRSKLTENIGLKIVSVLAAFILWLVVVNVDDPVINRTYSGIPVEVLNESEITDADMCYEILGGTDTISVVISAKRSVLDDMSRDYIRATADMKNLTSMDTVPIEVKVTRYADAVESVSTRTQSLQIMLENIVKKTIPLTAETFGEVEEGYLLSTVTPKYDELVISGPESAVDQVFSAKCYVDVNGLKADESIISSIELLDEDGTYVSDERLTSEATAVSVNVVIWGTKEIPITCNVSGTPADGYSMVGSVVTDPGSVVITGRSAYLNSMSTITIPGDSFSISGATETVVKTVDISSLLPEGIIFADSDFDGVITVTADIEVNDHKTINVPTANITMENVPEGYKVTIVDVGEYIPIEIQGKGDTYDRFDGTLAIGTIDALSLVSRNENLTDASIQTGANDGKVNFTFPAGVSEVTPLYMQVIVEQTTETE